MKPLINRLVSYIDMSKQFIIYVDASNFPVASACMTKLIEEGSVLWRLPAVNSTTLTERWATIHKEAYAALWALQNIKRWIFGKNVIVYLYHNPITFLTEVAPISAKLMYSPFHNSM